jgi:FkbM family methyltransferase
VTPLNTRLLFLALLRDLDIDVICDVGSMNGSDALAFRRRRPRARVIAIEPNPKNLRSMRDDARLQGAGIEVVAAAVSNLDGIAPFFVLDADYLTANARRGMSSLRSRDDTAYASAAVDVKVLRLDSLLQGNLATQARMALWIDSEGQACEVLEGMRDIAAQVQLLHIEVESQACISSGQRLYPEARAMLEALAFEEIATDYPTTNPQFNAVYVRRGQSTRCMRQLERRVMWGQLRRRLIARLYATCPACARRLYALRALVAR